MNRQTLFSSPIKITGERVWRTYLGGLQLDEMQKKEKPCDSHFPEEWIASTVIARNAERESVNEGLCYAQLHGDRYSLKELLDEYPDEMLGALHNSKYHGQMGILVKLIDSLERLTIQVHPDKKNALRFFGSRFGKTECWYILSLRENTLQEPCLYMGFKEGVTKQAWHESFNRQDNSEMLEVMHKVRVNPGEAYIVRGGLPHAIGPGCMLLEIQEPTDYTLRVEKTTPAGFSVDETMIHQGIGYDNMFECFDYSGVSDDEAANAWKIKPRILREEAGYRITQVVGYEDTPCFRMERLEITSQFTGNGQNFFCMIVLNGSGEMLCQDLTCPLTRNDQFFVPAASNDFTIYANDNDPLTILLCYGPE